MTAPRIYTGAEARALREDAPQSVDLEVATGHVYGSNPSIEYFVRTPGADFAVASEILGARTGMPCEGTARLFAAAPDLAASVEHHAARADGLATDLHRVTMERDGARLSLDAAQAARIKQSLELADARAEVVRLRAALRAASAGRFSDALAAMEEGREAEESGA